MRLRLPLLITLALAGCNQPPEGLAVSITPADATTTADLVVSIDSPATDANGNDTVAYTFAWFKDDQPQDGDADTVVSRNTAKGQAWRVVVTPTDGKAFGPAAEAEVVIQNSVPTATVGILPATPGTDDKLEAQVDTDDADLERVQLSYAWTVDGEDSGLSSDSVPATDTRKGQIWEVTVTPRDSDGPGVPVTASVRVGNEAPQITGARIEPSLLTRLVEASCVGEGWSDANGDPEGYNVQWQVEGTEVATTATLDLAPYSRGSTVSCTLTPTDGEDVGDPRTSDDAFIRNAPPSLGGVVIGPADPTAGTEVSATLSDAVDVDGDPVTIRYSWLVNGTERSTLEVLAGNRYSRDDALELVATPNDGTEDGDSVRSNVLTAANSLPVVSSVTIGPADPATEDVVTATVVADDADGDRISLSYAWYVDGSVTTETSDSIDGAVDFDKHEEIYVIVTPSDGEDGAAVTSASVTAVNTPPPSPRLTMSDDEPAADDDVTCEIDVQEPDLDGDSLSYTFAWTVNGSAFTGATTTTYTGDTIAGSDRAEDDDWVCEVTPNDGDDDGITARRTLGITPPTAIVASGTLASTSLRRGSMPGTTYNDDCGGDEMLVGISGGLTSSGGYFASLAPRCAELELDCEGTTCTVNTGTVTIGTKRGGTGSVTVNRDCDDGEVVVGFRGRYGWYLDQITLRCAPVEVTHNGSDWEISLGTSGDITAVGGTGGSAFTQTDCSSGKLATRAVISAGSGQVDGFGLGCQDPDLEL